MPHRRLSLTTIAIAASLLLTAAPAMARGGGHDHGEGGHEHGEGGYEHGFKGGHDNGRHLGWFKHQEPFAPVYRYARPWLYRPQAVYSTGWRTPRAWGGSAWPWHRPIIATAAAWGLAWGLGSYFLFQAPPIVYVPLPGELAIPPGVVSVPWMDAPTPFDDPPGYASPGYTSSGYTSSGYMTPVYAPSPYAPSSYSAPIDSPSIYDPGPWAAPPPVFLPQRSLLEAAPPLPGIAALYPY